MKIIKKAGQMIIPMFMIFAIFGSTQCKLATGESNDLGGGSSTPQTVIPTTAAPDLIADVSSYSNFSLLSDTTIQGVKTFYLLEITGESTTVNITGDSALTTDLGLLTYRVTTTDSNDTGKIWLNGSLIEASGTSTGFFGRATLSQGINYLAFVIYRNGTAVGRSHLVKITSNVKASLYRFELIWDGDADLDLHLASTDWNTSSNTGTWHVYFNVGSTAYTATGYEIELDTDSDAYGPENLRVYDIPVGAEFKCWINYYSGSGLMNATLNLYQDNSVTPTHSWNVNDISYDEIITIGTWTTPNILPNTAKGI